MKPAYYQNQNGGRDRWMVSYLDVLTILLILFVAMAAQTLQNSQKKPAPAPVAARGARAPSARCAGRGARRSRALHWPRSSRNWKKAIWMCKSIHAASSSAFPRLCCFYPAKTNQRGRAGDGKDDRRRAEQNPQQCEPGGAHGRNSHSQPALCEQLGVGCGARAASAGAIEQPVWNRGIAAFRSRALARTILRAQTIRRMGAPATAAWKS